MISNVSLQVTMSVLLYLFISVKTADILVVLPVPCLSHHMAFRSLTNKLADHGHNLVVITPFPQANKPKHILEIDVHDVSISVFKNEFYVTSKTVNNDIYTRLNRTLNLVAKAFEKQLETEKVRELISNINRTFDLVIFEGLLGTGIVLAEVYRTISIQLNCVGGGYSDYETIGTQIQTILYPMCFRRRIYNLSIVEQLEAIYNHFALDKLYHETYDKQTNNLQHYFRHDIPSFLEMKKGTDLHFFHTYHLWDGNRPMPIGAIYIGGPDHPTKELPENLKSFLDSSKHGVIYISFGTNVVASQLPKEKIQILVNVLSKLRYDVLWKWDQDEFPATTENIRHSKWFPQSDLLKHSKVKLFITQGGLRSTEESIAAGVPLLGIPMMGDQWFNVEKYFHLGIGMQLDFQTITEDIFRSTVKTVIENESYRKAVCHLRDWIKDQPQSPLDRAVWWTEYVLRHGGARHLRSPAANMSWSEYLELELVTTLLTLLTSLIIFIVIVFRNTLKLVKMLSLT